MNRWAAKMKARQEAGLCRACGAPQAPGCARCETHRDEARARRRTKYAKRKTAGAGIEHGCTRKAAGGHIRYRPRHKHSLELNRAWQPVHRGKGAK